jgi:transposase InsO family protein
VIFGEVLSNKSDAAIGIMNWCRMVKTAKGKTVKIFHSDGGGEYRGTELQEFFKREGIQPKSTLPSTPEHNGIVERNNRTIFECARSMLAHCGLPVRYWGDAILYAIYIRNRCPTVADKVKTPYELWNNKKPSVRVWL